MDKSYVLEPSYRGLKHPTSRRNFYDILAQIPKLILILRHIAKVQKCTDITIWGLYHLFKRVVIAICGYSHGQDHSNVLAG